GSDQRGDVGDLQRWVGRRLDPQQGDILVQCGHDCVGVVDVDEDNLEQPTLLERRQLDEGSLVTVPGGDDRLADRNQVQDGRDRGHAGCERYGPPALERLDRLLEGTPGRV